MQILNESRLVEADGPAALDQGRQEGSLDDDLLFDDQDGETRLAAHPLGKVL